MTRMHARSLALAAIAAGPLLPACSSTSGSAPPRAAFRPIGGDETLLVWSAGMDAVLADPKDARLRDALQRMDARVLELPEALSEPDMPAEAVQLAVQGLLGPMSLRAGAATGEAAQRMPVWAQMTFRAPSADEARARAQRLVQVMSKLDVPSLGVDEAFHGLSVVPLGPVELHHGVARDGRPDTLVLAANGLRTDEPDLGTLDLPQGVAPVLAFKLDYRGLKQVLETFGGEEATQAFALTGMEDVVLQGGFGHGADRSYGALRTIGWVGSARTSGTLPSGRIPRAALERIPADATAATVSCSDLGGIAHLMRKAVTTEGAEAGLPPGTDPVEILREMTGFDLDRDLLDHLGETWGAYLSDSTGGGGLYSAVLFVQVTDEKGLRDALERFEGQIEEWGASMGQPLSVRHWPHAKADVATFAIPGLPIPLELSWALQDGWLVAAASSQGIAAALDQAAGGRGSLLDHAGFRASASGPLDDLVSLTFLDVPRFVRDGYPLVAMSGAALGNGLTSQAAPDRVPPMVVPGLAELARGARATVALGRVEGEDLVVLSQGDRSFLVEAAGIAGAVGPLPMLVGAMAGAFTTTARAEPSVSFETNEDMEDDEAPPGMEIEVEGMEEAPAPADPSATEPKQAPKEEPK
jgi:hypothetical protein